MLAAESNSARSAVTSITNTAEQKVFWKQIIKPVEPFLDQVVEHLQHQVHSFEPEIASFARYALTNQGKQLRPALVSLSGAAAGELNSNHVKVAVVIEMVHLATLVHDDVMDEAEMRRNRPTVASNWGNEVSVLLGDCLFAQALKLAAEFPTTDVCRCVAESTRTVCSGEIFQTLHRGDFDLLRDQYFKILEMKTAELFALACYLGAGQSGADSTVAECLNRFGRLFGTAYQIFDDCLDIFANEEVVGKSLGTDFATGKITLPVLIARDRASDDDRKRLRSLFLQYEPQNFAEINSLLNKYNALPKSVGTIQKFLKRAAACLEDLPNSTSRESLNNLTRFLSKQSETLFGS